jgi:hypothetical protein
MDKAIVDFTVKTFLREARERLEEAAAIARAAEACADAGKTAKAVEIANDIDDSVDGADQLLGMVAAIGRLSKT